MHGQFLEEYHIACHIFILFSCVWKEGLALYLIGCVLRTTPKLFLGGGGQSDIFEKIVEKEVKVSKLTFWNFFL